MKKILAIATLALAAGCTAPKPSAPPLDLKALSSFKVEVTSGQMGTAQSPLPFSLAGQNYTLKITAIGGDGQPKTDYNGTVRITAVPGSISGTAPALSNGVATASVTLSKAYGATRIWVEDPATLATGVTDAIYYRGPKLSDVQTSPTTTNSIFNGQRVQIDTSSNLVVTAIHVDGFYVTDVDAANEQWASIFCYTFSTPSLNVGDKITGLVGTVSEFLGFTELNDPTWTIAGTGTPPTPVTLTCSTIQTDMQMEPLESGLVQVNNVSVQVCPTYPTCPDYSQYKQWTLSLGQCLLNVTSNYSLIGFDPTQNVGKPFTKMVGTLRQVEFATPQWILEPRGQADVCCPSCTPALTQGC